MHPKYFTASRGVHTVICDLCSVGLNQLEACPAVAPRPVTNSVVEADDKDDGHVIYQTSITREKSV